MVPRISSSSNREVRNEKQLEFDRELFLSEVSTNLATFTIVLKGVVTNANDINKVIHGVLFRTAF